MCDEQKLSERHACRLVGQARSVQRHKSVRVEIPGLVAPLFKHARERPRFDYKRLTILVCWAGFNVKYKRAYRICKEHDLTVRPKQTSKTSGKALPVSNRLNNCWSVYFLSDSVTDGKLLRVYAAIDDHSRLCRAMDSINTASATRVVHLLDLAIGTYGSPKIIRTDNGLEFTSKAFDARAYVRGIEHYVTRTGKPAENAFADSFYGRIQEGILTQRCFFSVVNARNHGTD